MGIPSVIAVLIVAGIAIWLERREEDSSESTES